MKKSIALVLSFVMVLSLCACGQGGETKTEFKPGTYEDSVYRNESIGIGFRLPAGWHFYSEQELAELNQQYKESNITFDMFAANNAILGNVSLNVEKMDAEELEGLNLGTQLAEDAPEVGAQLEEAGYTDFDYQIGMANVSGEMHNALYTSAKIEGQPMYQLAFQKKCDGYLVTATITSFFQDARQDLLSQFFLLK